MSKVSNTDADTRRMRNPQALQSQTSCLRFEMISAVKGRVFRPAPYPPTMFCGKDYCVLMLANCTPAGITNSRTGTAAAGFWPGANVKFTVVV